MEQMREVRVDGEPVPFTQDEDGTIRLGPHAIARIDAAPAGLRLGDCSIGPPPPPARWKVARDHQ